MKSILFKKFDALKNEEFMRDLELLMELPQGKIKIVAEKLLDYISNKDTDFKTVKNDLAKICETDEEHFKSASGILYHIVKSFMENTEDEENPENIRDDLLEICMKSNRINIVKEKKQEDELLDVIRFLKTDVAPKHKIEQRRKETITGLLPFLSSIGSTVEIRAVDEKGFKLSVDTDPEKYVPAFADFVTIGTILIRMNKGNPDYITFQTDMKALKLLITGLNATLKEMERLDQLKDNLKSDS